MSDFIKITLSNGDKVIAHKNKIKVSERFDENEFIFITSWNRGGIGGFKIEKEEYGRICRLLGILDETPLNPFYLRPIEDLEFTIRTKNCLKAADIRFIGELVQCTEKKLLRIPNLGVKSTREIKAALSVNLLGLGTVIEDWDKYEKELEIEND